MSVQKNKIKNEYVTSRDLAEQTKIILGAIDSRFNGVDDRLDGIDTRLDGIDTRLDGIDTRLDGIDTRLNSVDDRFIDINNRLNNLTDELLEVRDELKTNIGNVQTLIDGYVKAQEDFKQEFVIMKEEIRQIKRIFKQKFGVEIKVL